MGWADRQRALLARRVREVRKNAKDAGTDECVRVGLAALEAGAPIDPAPGERTLKDIGVPAGEARVSISPELFEEARRAAEARGVEPMRYALRALVLGMLSLTAGKAQ